MVQRNPKRVVITGASSGIGAATAEAFAVRGARLVLASRNGAALESVAERCRAAGGEALTVPTDVTDAEAVAQLARRARGFLGEIDLWFSNVGIGALGPFHEVPIEAHRRVIEANLIGHLNDAHAVLPIFLEQERGTFVNMISVGAFVSAPMAVAYSASKFGLRGMSEALRGELSRYPHIHICDVYPTVVDTPAFHHSGNFTGRHVSVSESALDPRTVAQAVVRLADRPRKTVAIGAPAGIMKLTRFLAPNLSAAVARLVMERTLARTGPAPRTEGNLFVPPDDDGQVDGGFRSPGRPRTQILAATVAGLAAVLVGAGLLTRRRAEGNKAS